MDIQIKIPFPSISNYLHAIQQQLGHNPKLVGYLFNQYIHTISLG